MQKVWQYLKSHPLFGTPLLLGTISLFIIFWPTPKIQLVLTSQNPAEGDTKFSVYDSPTFSFNQTVAAEDFTASSIPEESWQIVQSGPNAVSLSHKLYLQVSQSYELTLTHRSGFTKTIRFTTRAEQNDPRYLQGVQKDMDKNYPLATSFPYETNLLSAIYLSPLTIEITIKSPYLTSTQAISQIKAYISNKGGDASIHKYVVVAPSPTPTPSEMPLTTQPDL
jgi:hypothetical protein